RREEHERRERDQQQGGKDEIESALEPGVRDLFAGKVRVGEIGREAVEGRRFRRWRGPREGRGLFVGAIWHSVVIIQSVFRVVCGRGVSISVSMYRRIAIRGHPDNGRIAASKSFHSDLRSTV